MRGNPIPQEALAALGTWPGGPEEVLSVSDDLVIVTESLRIGEPDKLKQKLFSAGFLPFAERKHVIRFSNAEAIAEFWIYYPRVRDTDRAYWDADSHGWAYDER